MNHQKWRWRRFDNSTCGARMSDVLRYIIVCEMMLAFAFHSSLLSSSLFCYVKKLTRKSTKIIKKQKVSLSLTHASLPSLSSPCRPSFLLLFLNQNRISHHTQSRRRRQEPSLGLDLVRKCCVLLMMMRIEKTLECETSRTFNDDTKELSRIKTYATLEIFLRLLLMDHILER